MYVMFEYLLSSCAVLLLLATSLQLHVQLLKLKNMELGLCAWFLTVQLKGSLTKVKCSSQKLGAGNHMTCTQRSKQLISP